MRDVLVPGVVITKDLDMTKRILSALAAILLVSCASVPSPYASMSEAKLDREYCGNSQCHYEIALSYFNRGNVRKGWAYMDLSARDGYPSAQKFFINNQRPVPALNPNANYSH